MQIDIPTSAATDLELPHEVEKLYDLVYNLWWTWSPSAQRLLSAIDPEAWARHANPVQLLTGMSRSRWESLIHNDTFMASYHGVLRALDSYLQGAETSWFRKRYPEYGGGPIAYFSMEYALHTSLPIYSGGLGVLSGDHCKSASDLGLPFVAIGLLYRHGYFRQTIDAQGLQQHFYPDLEFALLPLRPMVRRTGQPLLVEVPLPDREVSARVWCAQVGRVPLLLLDTDVSANHPADRAITSGLYVSGREMRLSQELVVGVGGARVLQALGIEPAVWHINEGHSALLGLERLRLACERGDSLEQALVSNARVQAFTTHTPVPAGHESFAADVAQRYLAPWATMLARPVEELTALGHAQQDKPDQPLNLTAFAIRTSSSVNGVSRLHAEVSNEMWIHLIGARGEPIAAITNGVHLPTWVGPQMRDLLSQELGLGWEHATDVDWSRVEDVPDHELWSAHQAQKQMLALLARRRLLAQFARHGCAPDELRRVGQLLDPEALTLGFARRFATYKRADLIFSDLDRLRVLLQKPDRPVQIILAGKAHPADRPGQQLIQRIFELSQEPDLVGRVVFIENYDMQVGGTMVQGVDVWLNTPRRPLEASGTSGMKAAVNGVLNCSIADGWWPEGYNGNNGWVLGEQTNGENEAQQDQQDALYLYKTLEELIVPLFFERDEQGLPRRWIAMMKSAIRSVGPFFSTTRMVQEYVERTYMPLARGGDAAELE